MKRYSVLAMLTLVLVFGLAFVGCDNGTTKEVPNITEFYPRTLSGQTTPTTSFTTDQEILFTAWYTSPYQDLARFVVYIKKGGVTQDSWDMVKNEYWGNKTNIATIFTFGGWKLSAGSYTAELYAEDVKGNRSKTVKTSFTVR